LIHFSHNFAPFPLKPERRRRRMDCDEEERLRLRTATDNVAYCSNILIFTQYQCSLGNILKAAHAGTSGSDGKGSAPSPGAFIISQVYRIGRHLSRGALEIRKTVQETEFSQGKGPK
jgi:hypothetical protein